jgi:antitoxin (DNA-binding transcriptional repressor) of toxin-antitoxin stability system
MLMAMAITYISEADAVRDFAAVLAHVRAGSEVVIEGESAPVAVLIPPTDADSKVASDPEYDGWFCSQVQEALDDPRPGIPNEEVEAEFAQRRAASLLKVANTWVSPLRDGR